jgi:hypothetical protein
MKTISLKLLWIPILIESAAFAAQNADVSLLAGPIPGSTQTVAGYRASVSTSVGGALQIDFGYQVLKTAAGDLWVESPVTLHGSETTMAGSSVSVSDTGSIYWTPGVRFKVPVESHISFYGVAGVGLDTSAYESSVGNFVYGVKITTIGVHATFDAGGGTDFRLTRLLSIRAEARDFVTVKGLDGVSGRNHPVFLFGLALHF